MAEDWIKIRTDLYEDQDVLQLSDILGTDDATTVGLLVRFWSWADKQTIDGTGIKITKKRIDALTGRPGFAAAMQEIGWLSGDDGDLHLPNFQRHNGASAKARALESEAKRLRRTTQRMSDKLSDNCPTKEAAKVGPEKRREEKNSTHTHSAGAKDETDIEIPAIEQIREYARTIGLAEWRAEDEYHKLAAAGWKYQGQIVAKWKSHFLRVKGWWEADGRPMARPKTNRPGNRNQPMNEAERDRKNTGLEPTIQIRRLDLEMEAEEQAAAAK